MAINIAVEGIEQDVREFCCRQSNIRFNCFPANHVMQKSDWDCGITCIKMILPNDKLAYLNENEKVITGSQGDEFHSIWTIDLAYILQQLDVNFKYYTACFGISPELFKHHFYELILSKDYSRLVEKFQRAKCDQIPLYKDIISTDKLIEHLKNNNGPIIVLADAKRLRCNICFRCKRNSGFDNNFQGHYILVIGYSLSRNHIAYLDPSRTHGPCFMSIRRFDLARHANGTDHDTILIFKNKS